MNLAFRKLVTLTAVAALATLAFAASAHAAFSGANGKLVFISYEPGCTPPCDSNLYTANPDGSARTRLLDAAGHETDPQWSPDGGEIAYAANRGGNNDVYTLDAGGAGVENRVTTDPASDFSPAWTPDGTRIVFVSNRSGNNDLWSINADGTGAAIQLTSEPTSDSAPAVSPDGSRVAFTRRDGSCTAECSVEIYVMNIDGSGVTQVPIQDRPYFCFWRGPKKLHPDWSPSGDRLVFSWTADADCEYELDYIPERIETIRPDGTDQTLLREHVDGEQAFEPAWSPDGSRVVYGICCGSGSELVTIDSDDGANPAVIPEGDMADWQPLPVNTPSTHVRPAGASPLRASLVPAFNACIAPNREHGPPLAFGSCAPPAPGSPNLTVGVGDGSPAFSRSIGYVRMAVNPGVPGGTDDTDVGIRFSLSNVMRASDLSEYTGELRATAQARLTDREGAVSQTTQDFPLQLDVPCVATAPTIDKSLCEVATTLDGLIPGAAAEGTRAIWALDQVKMYDGGPDEDADTTADNSLFAVQGVFAP